MQDISGFGSRVTVRASVTFPQGFTLTQFPDDADPFDSPALQIADKAMGLNGDMVKWSKANPVPLTLSVIPDTDDDRNMAVLFEANRVARGKQSARDVITVTIVYPDGKTKTFSRGCITDGPPATGVASAGRKKTKSYVFAFETLAEA